MSSPTTGSKTESSDARVSKPAANHETTTDKTNAASQPADGIPGFATTEREMIARVDQVAKRRYEYHRTRSQKPDTYRFTKNFGFQNDPPQIDPKVLYHSLAGLEKLVRDSEKAVPVDNELLFELRAGIKFVYEDFSETFASLKNLLPHNQINFECLWTLYPPNSIVWSADDLGHTRAWKVASTTMAKDEHGIPWLVLSVDYIDYDGEGVGWVKGHMLKLPWFDGVRTIWKLNYIPLDTGPDPARIKKLLLNNGKEAIKRHGRGLVEYQGSALTQHRNDWIKFHSHGRVMLDPETWSRTQPQSNPIPSISHISQKSLLEDDEKLMVVNSLVYGYSMGDQIWGQFSVSQMRDPEWNDDAFEALVLEEDLKHFVRDLVSEHKAGNSEAFDDVIRDKGKGLVGLLNGPPGVGKTLTAEAVAEITRRPLYVISSGQLGHSPTDIHKELKSILELAEHWDAVVLLDEADVFMAARSDLDLSRNATVSIFLRELEYYQGIIILTTNRATSIDAAFQSRVHFTIQYPELDEEGRNTIWKNFMSIASKNKKLRMDIDEAGIQSLSRMALNGRQIKNAMSVAQAVALKRDEPLTVNKVCTAIKLSQQSSF
ncbi:AAA family ATPase [Pleurostoma richardsiae]|uniref:AAA family ATPase n=1 Tax=Pleurostoma richardsiae TaxID=41990 RepID=A0AA38VSC6_9PEZI|nr:AAA family ATPase [Pleurostoma richardsiae]